MQFYVFTRIIAGVSLHRWISNWATFNSDANGSIDRPDVRDIRLADKTAVQISKMFAVNTKCPRFLAKILPLFSNSNVSYRQPSTKIKFARSNDSTWVRITAAKLASFLCPELDAFALVPALGSRRTKPIRVDRLPFRRETPRFDVAAARILARIRSFYHQRQRTSNKLENSSTVLSYLARDTRNI